MRDVCWSISACALLIGLSGCLSTEEDLEKQQWRCDTSEDCGSGWQCTTGGRRCIAADQDSNGVFDDRVVIGMTAPIEKAPLVPGAEIIGRSGRNGMLTAFSHINRTGGVHGRRLELKVVDDNYLAEELTRPEVTKMVSGDNREVFLVSTVIGSAPAVVAHEVTSEHKVVLFGSGAGVESLEPEPPAHYVFNYRLRYSEEMEQMMEYMKERDSPRVACGNFAIFTSVLDAEGTPGDVGQSGVVGGERGLRRLCGQEPDDIMVATYIFDTIDVDSAVGKLLRWAAHQDRVSNVEKGQTDVPVGIIMLPAFDSGAKLIKVLSDQIAAVKRADGLSGVESKYGVFAADELQRLAQIDLRFGATSNAGLAMVTALRAIGSYSTKSDGVFVSRRYGADTIFALSVPEVESEARGVVTFLEHLEAYKEELPEDSREAVTADPFSLEGYLVGMLLAEAFKAHGRDLTTESFIDTLETLTDVNLGLGVPIGFSDETHQALKVGWGHQLDENLKLFQVGLLVEDT